MAQFDDQSVCVYQAFRPEIAEEAVRLQRFGAAFSLERMSWVKPNFLWMMFRCGWATKLDQDRVLAIRLQRSFFETVLRSAVASSYEPGVWPSREAWQQALRGSDVRLQWDPDHGPSGAPLTRRAIQLGLRGETLRTYASAAIVEVEDVTPLATAQRRHAVPPFEELQTPAERVFAPNDPAAAARVGLDVWGETD